MFETFYQGKMRLLPFLLLFLVVVELNAIDKNAFKKGKPKHSSNKLLRLKLTERDVRLIRDYIGLQKFGNECVLTTFNQIWIVLAVLQPKFIRGTI